MSTRTLATALAVLFFAGCSAAHDVQAPGGVLEPSQSINMQPSMFNGPRFDNPAPMPSPHLLTSIDTSDVLAITPSQAAPYLVFGHTTSGAQQTDTFSSVGVDAIPYTDIDHYIPGDQAGTNPTLSMSDVAMTCDGQYVEWIKPGHPMIYLTDPRIPGTLAAWEQWYTNFAAAGGQTWGIYEDTANNPFTYAVPAPPCNAAQTGVVTIQEWTAAEEAQEGAMQTFTGKAIMFNGLAPGYNKNMPYASALLSGPVAGGEAEACAPSNTTEWLNQITEEIAAVQNQKYFLCHGNDQSDGSTPQAIAFRNYHFASMMLDFDPAHTIYEPYFSVGASNLRVQPESEVVMLHPYKTAVNVPTDLLTTSGVYVRRYRTCWVAGTLIGQCAAVVNPTNAAVKFPYPATWYQHTMLLEGSGVYDGATVSALGPAPSTSVGAYSGEIVFP